MNKKHMIVTLVFVVLNVATIAMGLQEIMRGNAGRMVIRIEECQSVADAILEEQFEDRVDMARFAYDVCMDKARTGQ